MKVKDIKINEWYKTKYGILFISEKLNNEYYYGKCNENEWDTEILKNTDIKYPVVKRWVRKQKGKR